MCVNVCGARDAGSPLSVVAPLGGFSRLKQGITFLCPSVRNTEIHTFAVKDRNRLARVGKHLKIRIFVQSILPDILHHVNSRNIYR